MTTSPTLKSPSILQSMYWNNLENLNMAQADRDRAQATVAGVAAVQDAFDVAVVSINQNGDLSAQGRASALLAASKRALGQLAAQTAPVLAALDAQIVACARALRSAANGHDVTSLSTEIRAVEARAAFAQIDPLLRPTTYLTLCANGEDDAACIAVENSSGFAPLLAPAVVEQGRAVRGARELPDQAGALDTAQDLRALLAASVAAVRRHVSLGPTADPLQVASLGAYPINQTNDEA